MRYVGLVFLGMVLWAGQVTAEPLDDEKSLEVLVQGKTISQYYGEDSRYNRRGRKVRYTRVIYRKKLYICEDGMGSGRSYVYCWDDKVVKRDN